MKQNNNCLNVCGLAFCKNRENECNKTIKSVFVLFVIFPIPFLNINQPQGGIPKQTKRGESNFQ